MLFNTALSGDVPRARAHAPPVARAPEKEELAAILEAARMGKEWQQIVKELEEKPAEMPENAQK